MLLGSLIVLLSTLWLANASDAPPADQQLAIEHSDCSYFGADRERFVPDEIARGSSSRHFAALGETTRQVTALLAGIPGGNRAYSLDRRHPADSIDSYIFGEFRKQHITPADATTDWEFIRRITLDLTGRIPTPERVLAFVSDGAPDKRAKLTDELLARPEWVDKWTMYFGDLLQNSVTKPSTGLNRFAQGRNAFYQWIRDSLANNKPYNQMAAELITASGDNSYTAGANNFLLNGYTTGGPQQDTTDAMTAATFTTFLGLAHVNCLLCHNGRGHTDGLSVWASSVTRYQAWQLASYFSHTQLAQVRYDSTNTNVYYWSVADNTRNFTLDYALNTTTGNRPSRVAPPGCKSGQPCYYVAPEYIFNGNSPRAGENYRVALARDITADFQFARAAVNYMWAYFFGRGLVDPPDAFDPARLDPDKPPPAPWALQPSNPALLNALARHFVDSKYDLKALMREIVNSDAYQLSSRYNGQWSAAWEPYFARKFVRRLWAEEVHDAIAQSSGTFPSYAYTGFTDQGYPRVSYAMQLPDVVNAPSDSNAVTFLDSFLRGNRDDQPRKYEGSISQALNMMNNTFVVNRSKATGGAPSQLISQNLSRNNADLISTLYLNILSRLPGVEEVAKAQAAIPASGSTRTAAVQDLVWALYNKVDFVFNY
jgi:hypothetical protein